MVRAKTNRTSPRTQITVKDVKIGLETHVQLNTDTKLFCGCKNSSNPSQPNTHTCPVCLGHPGTRPKLNKAAVEAAVMVGKSLDCTISENSTFARKSYFYPDMSKNYQITQYDEPIAKNGGLEAGGNKISIKRMHIEEDPAQMTHEGGQAGSAQYSLVDYNRAGTPLLEIVTEPVIESPEQARDYLNQLTRLLTYLGVYSKSSGFTVKSDANISVAGGNRVEVKNITGAKEVVKALKYEISRQKQTLERNGQVKQETRRYNPSISATEKLREKESEEDYGYIIEPDLPTVTVDQEMNNLIESKIPELPEEKKQRFLEQYEIPEEQVESILISKQMAEDFEHLSEDLDDSRLGNAMAGTLRKVLNYNSESYDGINESSGNRHYLRECIRKSVSHLEEGNASDRTSELYIREAVGAVTEKDASTPPRFSEKFKVGDKSEAQEAAAKVVEENSDAVDDYKTGKDKALNFLVGKVMEKTEGGVKPKDARDAVKSQMEN